jgi:hypothetical protein
VLRLDAVIRVEFRTGDNILQDELAGRTGSLAAHRYGARLETVLSLMYAACGIPDAFASNE